MHHVVSPWRSASSA